MSSNKNKSTPKSKATIHYIPKIWSLAIGGMLMIFLFFALLSLGFMGNMPNIKELENPKNSLSSELFAEDGRVMAKYFLQNRTKIQYSDLAQNTVDALISTEDVRFYNHSGIDARSLGRALKGMGSSGGGSTISQQLAKNLFSVYEAPSMNGKIMRIVQKLKEWVISVRLEKRYSKDEILCMYLNTVPFTNLSWGIDAASKEFFNKRPKSLTTSESAVLVGMLKANTKYNPKRNPIESKKRRNVVLYQMLINNKIDKSTFDKLSQKDIVLNYHREEHEGMAAYFKDYVSVYLKDWCKKNGYNLFKSGLKVYTTVDFDLQLQAEAAVDKHMKNLQRDFLNSWGRRNPWTYIGEGKRGQEIPNFIEDAIKKTDRYKTLKNELGDKPKEIIALLKKPIPMSVYTYKGIKDTIMSVYDSLKLAKKTLHAGFIAISPEDGHVKAWVGGINHEFFKYDHVNIGVRRQVGSTFKPLVYATCLDINKASPCSAWPRARTVFNLGGGKTWSPSNDGGGAGGSMTMADGLAQSDNLITAQLMKSLGPNSPDLVAKFAERVGIVKDRIPRVYSICLGTVELSPFEMASAFLPFANKGLWLEPTFISRIEDQAGNIIYESTEPKHDQVLSEEKAYLMYKMLTGVVLKGTAKRLTDSRFGITQAAGTFGGKTGTTQGSADGWYIGLNRNLVVATWVGADDPSVRFGNGAIGQGAAMALPIYAYFMQSALLGNQNYKIETEMIDKPIILGGKLTDCGVEVFDPTENYNPESVDKNKGLDIDELLNETDPLEEEIPPNENLKQAILPKLFTF